MNEMPTQPRCPCERIITDALGFSLKVDVTVGYTKPRGRHKTYQDEQGLVEAGAPHIIELRQGLRNEELVEVIAHEAYHLFYSIRNLITADEETEAETFGHLVKRLWQQQSLRN